MVLLAGLEVVFVVACQMLFFCGDKFQPPEAIQRGAAQMQPSKFWLVKLMVGAVDPTYVSPGPLLGLMHTLHDVCTAATLRNQATLDLQTGTPQGQLAYASTKRVHHLCRTSKTEDAELKSARPTDVLPIQLQCCTSCTISILAAQPRTYLSGFHMKCVSETCTQRFACLAAAVICPECTSPAVVAPDRGRSPALRIAHQCH